MNTSLLKASVCAAIVFIVLATSQPCHGNGRCAFHEQDGPHACQEHELKMKQFEKELRLTEDQKARLAQLRTDGNALREEHMKKMKEIRRKMKEELAKDTPDGNKLMDYASQIADLVEQQTKARVEHLLKVKNILTKEQFEKMLTREWRDPADSCPKDKEGGQHHKRHEKKTGQMK